VSGAISTCLAMFMYFCQIIVIFAWAVFTAALAVKPAKDMMTLLLPYIIFLVAFALWRVCSAFEVAFYPSDIPVPRKVVHNLLIFLFVLVSLTIAAFLCTTIISGGEHTSVEFAADSTMWNATTVALDIVVNGTHTAPQLLSASRALVVNPVTLQVIFILNIVWLAFLLIMIILPCYCERYPVVYRAYAGALETSRNEDDGGPNSVCLDVTPQSHEKEEDAAASHEPPTRHYHEHEDSPAASEDDEEQK
jgi:hypothetical protein